MVTMATTIQLNEETKKKLFLEKNRLEKELGRSISYDDVIQHLLSRKGNMIPVRTLKELQGTLEKEAQIVYKELRAEYESNED